jgi:H+/gluconate symporter-like permease
MKNIPATPMSFVESDESGNNPSVGISLSILLLPVALIAIKSFVHFPGINLIGEPMVALLISVFAAVYFLGIKRGISWAEISKWLVDSIKDVSPLMLTFGGAGACGRRHA